MSEGRVYIDGSVSAESEARIPAGDRGFLYGDALFETLRTYGGEPFLLDRHLERLMGSCQELEITPRESPAEIAEIVLQLVAELKAEAYVRIAISRGSGYGPWPKELPEHGRTVIAVRPLVPPAAELYARGMRVATSQLMRFEGSPLVGHKTANYLEAVLARGDAAEHGADEALLLNTAGRISELSAANVFAVVYGRLLTPDLEEGPLPGITRQFVLELAEKAGIKTHCGQLTPEALGDADEAFATSSLLEICPIAELDGQKIGEAVPGQVTQKLQAAYRAATAQS
ncbi:MAG TPA: aminotransferase class IV [Planctomycetota bacterium]|nr:aminotransferase class IV [Planctomycetota bacterium]